MDLCKGKYTNKRPNPIVLGAITKFNVRNLQRRQSIVASFQRYAWVNDHLIW